MAIRIYTKEKETRKEVINYSRRQLTTGTRESRKWRPKGHNAPQRSVHAYRNIDCTVSFRELKVSSVHVVDTL